MAPTIQTIGIANGGGDCPGLNVVIRSAVRAAILSHGWKVIGINDGFDGLIWTHRTVPLPIESIPGILPRGGSLSPFDRILSTRFGVEAVELIARGNCGRMVCLRAGEIESVTLDEAVGIVRLVDPHGSLVRTARAVCITFGDGD